MFSREKTFSTAAGPRPQSQNQLYYLDDVSINYGKTQALKSLHLTIYREERIFVTGPSGAGKTTLLKVLGGIIPVENGRFVCPDENYRATMVFQDLKLLDYLTCEENLWLTFDPLKYKTRDDFGQDLQEYSKFFGIQHKLHSLLKETNGGLRQKVAIIRSLLSCPQVLLADEPTSALDKDNAVKLFELLNYLNEKKGLTFIWASHNKELIKHFNGRIIHLEGGKLIYTGHACFI